MPYITREDGEHFVIPSYREVLTVKQKNQLKREILLLSQSYGEYITMQRKGTLTYELAFSPDTGYLLGESIWHNFKRPFDMVYCEAIPNSNEAILVIVKDGSVYLDGSFPVDTIPEELVIFLTQQSNFEIYVYGEVPISQTPEPGKFNFDAAAVKSFNILDNPVFPKIPLLRIYELQPVELVLKSNRIGTLPTQQIVTVAGLVIAAWLLWSYFVSVRTQSLQSQAETNPYQSFLHTLNSPAPEIEIYQLISAIQLLYTMPGWTISSIKYSQGSMVAFVKSTGGETLDLLDWAKANKATVDIHSDGISVTKGVTLPKRPLATKIYPLKEVLATFVDRLAIVYPGNRIKLGDFKNRGNYTDVSFTILLTGVSPVVLNLIGNQFQNLPFVLTTATLDVDKRNNFNGSITIQALGS